MLRMTTYARIGLSPLDATRCDVVLDLPHFSPVTHGMLLIDAQFDSGPDPESVITKATAVLGSMHRGAEKLFESRDYRQILMLASRHEWLSPFSGETGVAQLLERELGITVPLTARWLRTLLLEFNRVTSHMAFLAGFPWDPQLSFTLGQLREPWVELLQSYTGSRMHPMITCIGGLTHAPTDEWLTTLDALCASTRAAMTTLLDSGLDTIPTGLGILSPQTVTDFALSGPAARASNVYRDLRTTSTQLMYHEIADFEPLTQTSGDVAARLRQLRDELLQAIQIIQGCISHCRTGLNDDINVLLPKVIRVPEGRYEHSIETPLGIASWYLVSQNDKMPYRLKLRPASLHTVLALSEVLVGATLDQAKLIIASMPFLSGDADR